MCGITGFWSATALRGEADHDVLRRMTEALRHRGPDADGVWTDDAAGVALGHRRLSIVDLSPLGAQPMHSRDGRFVTVYNGEIYNFPALRAELEALGASFRGGSDTEVMLEAIAQWGLGQAVTRFIGMFAFALWDRRERRLSLVRDRLGIKPLHYVQSGRSVLFASELSALRANPSLDCSIDRAALGQFLRFGYVPAPRTIYSGVRKLEPGCILTLEQPDAEPAIERYWSAQEVALQGRRAQFQGSPADVADELERLLTDAVRLRLVADVPLGAFLSGGIDSSTVVSLMQKVSTGPVRTFSIGFEDKAYDEATHARAVARWIGTQHTELRVTAAQTMGVIPELPRIFDEPFADSSQIPTYLVSKLARQSVTVSLSGDGGDELFGGYNRYLWVPALQAARRRLPAVLRDNLGRLLQMIPPDQVDDAYSRLEPVLPQELRMRLPGEKLAKAAQVVAQGSLEAAYAELVSSSSAPELLLAGDGAPPGSPAVSALPVISDALEGVERMMLLDLLTYLPDDILTKVDRASMAVSLEARVPILDHRVVAFAWSLPMRHKVLGNEGKLVLRQVLDRYVPRYLIDRPKMGFAIPIDRWLRGELRPWAEDLLSERRILTDGYLDPARVRDLWQGHLSGRSRHHHKLWAVLMFQAWLAGQTMPPGSHA